MSGALLKTKVIFFSALLFVAVLAPITPQGIPTAEALTVTVVGGTGTVPDIKTSVESTISAAAETIQTGLQTTLNIKELTLDGIAFGLMKTVLKGVTNSILNWINGGFQGSPAFVTDLDGFLTDLADQTAGDFIYGSELGFLCSPFQLDVRIALEAQYQAQKDYAPICTLSDVSDNLEGFLNGTFSDGGWEGWFELTQGSNNDPVSAYLNASAQMEANIITAEGRKIQLLSANDFFLNIEICDSANHSAGNKQNCQTTTPGKVISEQLTFQLESGSLALIEADEINEIVGALFAQLGQQALMGVNGLLGLGGNSTYSVRGPNGGDSYFADINQENQGLIARQSDIDGLPQAIVSERRYRVARQGAINRINRVVTDYDEGRAQFPGCYDQDTDRGERPLSFAIDGYFNDELVRATQDVTVSLTATQILNQLQRQYTNATAAERKYDLVKAYNDLRTSGAIHTQPEVIDAELYLEYDLDPYIELFRDQMDNERERCSARA